MSIPPGFGDLGKKARDIFNKGYNYGTTSLEVTSKTASKVDFKVNGVNTHETGKTDGSLETTFKSIEYGLTFKESWHTSNKLTGELSVEDKIIEGLKLTFQSSFSPLNTKKSALVKAAYKRPYLNFNVDTDFDFAGPTFNGGAVFGYQNWLLGVSGGFDSSKSVLTRHTVAMGYTGKDFTIHTAVKDGSDFSGSVYHSPSSNMDVGVDMGWRKGNDVTRFGIGAKYQLDKATYFKAKVNNSYMLGLAFSHKVRSGITANFSTMVDLKAVSNGSHKLGAGFEFDTAAL